MKITSGEVSMSKQEFNDILDTCLAIGMGLTNESFAQTIKNPPKTIFDERLKNMSDTLKALDKLDRFAPELVEELKETYSISKTRYKKLTDPPV